MAGNGYGYPDFFSEAEEAAAHDDDDEFGLGSQAQSSLPAAHNLSASRRHMQNLDLNSQADSFPFLDEYSGYLQQPDGGLGSDEGLPSAGRGVRGGRGSRGGMSFLPPRPSGSGSRGGRGRGQLADAGSRGGRGGGKEGGGRGRALATRLGHRTTSLPGSSFPPDDAGIEEEDDNGFQMNRVDKANWTEANIYIFCELAVEQIRAENCLNGTMSTRGYKIIAKKYFDKTKLWHDTKQLKNRWTQCKTLYTFHVWSQGQTGLGRNNDGTVSANEAWWRKHTEKRPECRKFKQGIPPYLEYLREMFHGVTVDGRSSCIPGEDYFPFPADGDEGSEDADDFANGTFNSPMSSNSRKRGSSTTDTATIRTIL